MKTSLLTLSLLLLFAATDSLAGVLRVGTWSSSGSDPHSTLTAALTAATAGDEIWVVQGLYREAELAIPSGVSVYGGFTGSETNLSERNYAANVTILDGSGAHRVATVSGLLDGFTLRNGRTGDNGGGVIVKSGGVFSHCIAFANEAGYDGGGVFAEEGANVTNTLLTGNRAGNDGAAISGARGFNAMNITAADNTFTGIPVIDALTGVPASLQAGGVLDVAPPAISADGGSTVLMKGWELDGNAISMPYTVTYGDNGKKLRYWAANAVGVGVSAEVALKIEWVATFRESLRTPIAVCEGTTLAAAGLVDPAFGVEPGADAGTVTRDYYFLGVGGADTKLSGLDYALQYADNNKLLVCRVYKNGVLSAETPAVRVAVMKAPQILLTPAPLSAEDGERLCLPAPVVLSNGSDVTAQGWHWKKGADGGDFTSCDVVDKATLDGATLYYTATNACSATPVSLDYGVLSVAEAVGEFSLKLDEICSGTKLADAIGFADGNRADGVYTIGGTIVPDFDTYVLTEADNLKQLKYTYNGGKNERRLTLTVHSVPAIQTQPVSPADAICKGSGHSLSVVVSGESLRYQWEESADNGTTWSPVAGATDSYLRLNVENDRQYHCTVTGVCISKSAGYDDVKKQIVSAPATVSVTDVPAITGGPTAQVTLCENTVIGALTIPAITDNGSAVISQSWTLNGININPATYKVTSADHGKVLGYRARNACGETVVTFDAATLNIEKRPQLLQVPVDVTTEENNQVRFSVLTAENNVTYAWYKEGTAAAIAGANKATYAYTPAVLTGADLTAGERTEKYYCVITTTTSMCKGNNADATPETSVDAAFEKSSSATVTIRRKTTDITIEAQPDAFPEACAGSIDKINEGATGGIRVTATGRGPLAFRWYKNGKAVVGGDGTAVEGAGETLAADPDNALAPTLRQTSTFTPTSAGTYYCLVTSADNTTGVRSEQSVLTVHGIPDITENLTDLTRTLCADSELSLRIAATGSNRAYQWQKKTGADFVNIAGETDVRLRTTVDADATYRCVVTATCKDGKPADEVTLNSAEVAVTMSQKPTVTLAATASPITQCEDAAINLPTASLTVNNNHSAIPAADEWWTLGGQKVAAGYLLKTADNGKSLGYRAANGCGETVVTFPVTVQVDDNPVIVQDPQDAEVQMGSNVRLSIRATGSGALTYQWQKKAAGDADFTAASDGGTVSGAKTNTLSFIAAAITDITVNEVKTQYRCIVTTNNVCGSSVTSLASTVAVQRTKSNISILRQPQGYEICSGAAYQDLTVEVSGTGEFYYEWFKSDGTVVKAKAGNSTVNRTDSYRPTAAGNYYCVVTSTDDATGVRTQQALVTVYQIPVNVTVSPDNTSVCEGNTFTLGVSMVKGDSPVYQWYSKTAAGGGSSGGAICTGATSSTFTPLNLTANADGTAKDYYYYCEVESKYCPGTKVPSSLAAVKVNKSPKISVQPQSQTICQGSAAPLTITAATDKANGYTWYLNGVVQAGTSNAFNATKAGVYTCEVSSQQCGSVLSAPALITVASTPTIKLAATDGGDLTACKGDMVVLPSPLIDAKGSLLLTDKSGWYAAGQTKLVSSYVVSKQETWTYKLMYKCSEDAADEKTYTGVAPTLTVKMTPQPSLTGSLKAETLTLNAGEQVTETSGTNALLAAALTVKGATGAEWLLGGMPVTLPYTVSAADNGKSFEVRARNTCGEEVYLMSGANRARTTLTVNSLVITTQPVSQTYCEGVAGKTLSVATNITGGVGYQWYKDGGVLAGKTGSSLPLGSATSDAGVYTCEVKLGTLTVVSSPAVITVNAKPSIVNNSQNVTVCKGSPVTLQVEAKGHDLQYSWNQGITSTSSAVTVTPTSTTTYTCTVKNSCDNTGKPSAITVTVNSPVAITTQPKDQNECNYAALSVAATGTATLNYKWSNNGTAISGATAASYTPTADGVYTCEVSNACGSITSAPAVVKKKAATAIATQPLGATICKGESVSLGVKATGDDLTYQWYSGSASNTVTTEIKGATSSTLSVSPAVNTYYKCTVSGCSPVTSNVVQVTVNSPVLITSQPKDQNECNYVALSVAATGTATLSYKWSNSGSPISGATAASYTPTADGVYTCEVSNACGSITSAPAVVKKKAATAIATQPLGATICKGESVSLGVKATGDDLTYQWYSGTTNNPTTLISGATSATLSVSPAVNTFYKCTVSGCSPVTSNVVLVTVQAPTVITALSGQPAGTGKVCNTATMPKLAVTATGEGTLAYQWYMDGAAIASATGANYTVKATDLGAHNYEVRVTGGCGNALSQAAVVDVVEIPEISLPTAGITACTGDVITLPVPVIEANGSVIDQASTGWCLSTNEALVNSWKVSGTAATTWRYKVAYTCGATTGQKLFSGNLTVTPNVAPTITRHPKDEVKCASDAFTNLSVTASGSATLSYQWYKDNTTQSGATGATYAVNQNAGVYHCVVSNACGIATSAPATLTRHAAIAATAYADKSALCGSEATIVGVKVTAGAAASYQWDKAGTAINGATSSTMAVVGEDGTGAVSRAYNCTVTDVCGKTVKPSVSITHNPVPKITAQPVGGDVCEASKEISVTATGVKSYQWYKDGVAISGATANKYTVPKAKGNNSYYCKVTSENCGSVESVTVHVNIVFKPSFYSTANIGTTYEGVGTDEIVLPAPPAYNANGNVITKQEWRCGTNTVIQRKWLEDYDGKKLHYYIEWNKGVCAAGNTQSPEMGTLKYLADFACDRIDRGTMNVRTKYKMIDTRDGKTYTIYLERNNQVWMLDNLAYGAGTTNINNGGALPVNTVDVWKNEKGMKMMGKRLEDGGTVFYDICGATQMWAGIQGHSSDAISWRYPIRGICPPGWRLPYSGAGHDVGNQVRREVAYKTDQSKTFASLGTDPTSVSHFETNGNALEAKTKSKDYYFVEDNDGTLRKVNSHTTCILIWGTGDAGYNNDWNSALQLSRYGGESVDNDWVHMQKKWMLRVRCIAD